MANWKKITNTKWKKGNKYIFVKKDEISNFMISNKGFGTQMWNVLIQVKGFPATIVVMNPFGDDATFTSKAEAVKYAKAYMRKH